MEPRQPGLQSRVWGWEVASADLSRVTRRLEGQIHRRNAQPQAETCSDQPATPRRETQKIRLCPGIFTALRQSSGQLRNAGVTAVKSHNVQGPTQGEPTHRVAGNMTQNREKNQPAKPSTDTDLRLGKEVVMAVGTAVFHMLKS